MPLLTARCAPSASPWASGPCSGPAASVSSRPSRAAPERASARCHAFDRRGPASSRTAKAVPWFTARRRASYGQDRASSPRSTARNTHSGCQGGNRPGVSTGTQVRRLAGSRNVGSGAVQSGTSACIRGTSTYSRVRASTSSTASWSPPAEAAASSRSTSVGAKCPWGAPTTFCAATPRTPPAVPGPAPCQPCAGVPVPGPCPSCAGVPGPAPYPSCPGGIPDVAPVIPVVTGRSYGTGPAPHRAVRGRPAAPAPTRTRTPPPGSGRGRPT